MGGQQRAKETRRISKTFFITGTEAGLVNEPLSPAGRAPREWRGRSRAVSRTERPPRAPRCSHRPSQDPSRVPARLLDHGAQFIAYYLENFKETQVYFPIGGVLARAGHGPGAGSEGCTSGHQTQVLCPGVRRNSTAAPNPREEHPSPSGARLGGTDGGHP